MPIVKVHFEPTEGATRRAHFNGVPLTFDGPDSEKNLPVGEHPFTWFIYAAPGTEYTVKVSTKKDPKLFTHTAVLASDMKDGGIQWLTIADSGK